MILSFVLFSQLLSCHHFSLTVSVSESEKQKYIEIDQKLSLLSSLSSGDEIDVLLYRNWQYSSRWNDLDSWKVSQDLFRNLCVKYWKIKPTRITVIEQDRSRGLEDYLKQYSGKCLIIYFVSHQTSKSQIVLNDGTFYPTERLANLLNQLNCETFLIYETCYAKVLKKFLKNDKVSVYYGAGSREEAFDFRPRGSKPSLNEMCRETLGFIKTVWGLDLKAVTPFGFYLVKAIIENSHHVNLGNLLNSVIRDNHKMTTFIGLGRYPQVEWSGSAFWDNLKIGQ
jgi:hypothetical protein